MFKLFSDVFKVLERHQKVGILKIQIIVIITAFTEVAGIATIGPFMALVSNPETIDQEIFRNLYVITNSTSRDNFLILMGSLVVGILFVSAIVATLSLRYIYHFAQRIGAEISSNLFDYYLSTNWLFHTQNNSSKLITNIAGECSRVTTGIVVPALIMNAKIVISLSIIIFLLSVDFLVTLVGFTIFGLVYFIIFSSVKYKLGLNGQKLTEHQNIRIKTMNEGFGGVKDILLMNRAEQFKSRFRNSSLIYGHAVGTQQTLSDIPKYWIELLAFGTMVLLILFLMIASKENFALIVPTLSMFAMASYKLIPAFQQIYFYLSGIKFSQSAIDSISKDLRTFNSNIIMNQSSRQNNQDLSYSIRLNDVTFSYPNKGSPVISNMSLEIPENSLIGFAGPSGSGKSTLIDIILGLLIPNSGSLVLGENTISKNNTYLLQSRVGYVPQTIFLSDNTIKNNIAFGLDDADIDEMKINNCIDQSQLQDLINSLPDGLETMVGEKGVQLSGGQRQRIAIARALYRKPKILVLDEATSALDGLTEQKIMQSIHKIASDITVIIIAHRLNTIKECDMIYFIESGKIVDSGSYDELISTNAKFQSLSKIS
ncbi:ABC transporter ATP-binding protein/permease [SAR86 cluster bacterium]|nr:ABC transporter ATP-binding protein/permease [SAR86 cluster bacterium]|tara:strand:+ start:2441 stop:4234 length:1794 start_codon:yes stop_codon:yes gene_type:complete